MNFKIWTPRYLLNRIKVAIHHQLYKDDPWLTKDSIAYLEKHLRPSDSGLEWGSGRSTIWFGKRVKSLISVETDGKWYKTVNNKIAGNGLHNIQIRITAGDTFAHMSEQITDIPEDSLDFVLIDGAVTRHITTELSIPLLKTGGLLIIDNINWYMPSPYGYAPDSVTEIKPEWAKVFEKVRHWKCHWTTDGVTDTAMWIKP
ncbi:MAG: class I SAM-dependent methyltransferase [Nitrospirota bacterium]|nr:class I SAM-dependent methyltransferase [Nitrospirota bacterium]